MPAAAQTTHSLLLQMREKAAAIPYGSYRLTVKEHYLNQRDTSRYFATCAFYRFQKPNDEPGLRFDLQVEGHAGGGVHQQRIVFDGQEKFDFRGDTLAMIYDTRALGAEFTFRGLQHFFFVPMLLHDGQAQRFLGPDRSWGTPPYRTGRDTLIGRTPCQTVVAEWVADSTSGNVQHLAFYVDRTSGLARRFVHLEWSNEGPNPPRILHFFEINVEEFSTELPYQHFYVDWPSLPAGMEVRRYYDCQFKELLRPRQQQPGL